MFVCECVRALCLAANDGSNPPLVQMRALLVASNVRECKYRKITSHDKVYMMILITTTGGGDDDGLRCVWLAQSLRTCIDIQ